ncbi:hypothetical protein AYJ57_03175 [Salipiger sp. CCB-MM3]|uniref:hypothetical protein n=1 Tax=Salipiger sp. CCB-MM3 TaxID=1792508 RepID=UPI00080A9EE7|nr:hypothetical protein [Salipiger sp. CCB-MM3]ANT59451.1 hypothetical protein AYJ57_03175 [Salipiger sp. CCB-MM3]
MSKGYHGAKLPVLPKGQEWYCALVEVIRMPDSVSPFFEDGDDESSLAVLFICLSAGSPAEVEVQIAEHIAECGGVAGVIEDVKLISGPLDLPLDEDGAPDAALLEAFTDPELGDEIVWGEVYLFGEEEEA